MAVLAAPFCIAGAVPRSLALETVLGRVCGQTLLFPLLHFTKGDGPRSLHDTSQMSVHSLSAAPALQRALKFPLPSSGSTELLGIQNRAFLHDMRVHGIACDLSQLVWRIPCLEPLLVDRHRPQRVQASPYRVLDRRQNSLIKRKTVQRAYSFHVGRRRYEPPLCPNQLGSAETGEGRRGRAWQCVLQVG